MAFLNITNITSNYHKIAFSAQVCRGTKLQEVSQKYFIINKLFWKNKLTNGKSPICLANFDNNIFNSTIQQTMMYDIFSMFNLRYGFTYIKWNILN